MAQAEMYGIRQVIEQNPADVREYFKFLCADGLSRIEEAAIKNLLTRIGDVSGGAWRPMNCDAIPHYTHLANSVWERSMGKDLFGELIPMRFLHGHFFWVSEMPDGRLFIIDPTGVPIEPPHKNITPFFGLLDAADGYHRQVYANLEPLDDWGTRSFPPGFHP